MTASEGLHSQNGNYAAAPSKFDVNDIVMHFGREYYTMLSCDPDRLHCFYGKQSSLLHCQEEDTEATVCVGLEEIHNRLVSMGYNGARVVIGNIDCQPSMNGGILIFVLGTMHWPTGVARKFVQTFLLAEQPNGYFVLNDIMRILTATEGEQAKVAKIATPSTSTSSIATTATTTPSAPKKEESIGKKPVESSKPVEQPAPIEATKSTRRTTETVAPIQPASVATEQQPKATVETKPPTSQKNETTDKPKSTKKTSPPQQTPKKEDVAAGKKETPAVPTTPSSWASLAAVQQNRWQTGIVAESKGPVVSIPVETNENGKHNNNNNNNNNNSNNNNNNGSRVNYRTNGNGGDRRRGSGNNGDATTTTTTTNNNNNNSTYQRQDQQREGGERREKFERYERNNENGTTATTGAGSRADRRFEYDANKSIYVHQIKGPVEKEPLLRLFRQFGDIKSFDIVFGKGMAFFEFSTLEAQKAALASSKLTFNNESLKVEPRRLPQSRDRDNRQQGQRNSPSYE